MGLYITFPIAILVEIVFPVLLGWWVIRRYHTSWKLVGIGGVIYLASQMLHIPLLNGIGWLFSNKVLSVPTGSALIVTTAIIYGLAAGLCEEIARMVGFRLLKAPVQNKAGAFSLGAGHAGVETLIVAGLPVLGTFVSMLALKNANSSDPALDAATVKQISDLWNMAWYLPLANTLDRLVEIITQMALTFMVLQLFVQKSYWWFAAAILWHAVVVGTVVALSGSNLSTGLILVFEVLLGAGSAGILWYLVRKPNDQPPAPVLAKSPG
jgi:uncharacterized membrane protein YhfC